MGVIISPFISPFILGFLAPKGGFRWTYGIGVIYSSIVLVLITIFGRETLFERSIPSSVPPPQNFDAPTLLGMSGWNLSSYRTTWKEVILLPIKLVWRPHLLSVMIFEGILFGFAIGLNVTTSVLLGEKKPLGYGYTQYAIAGIYATPIISSLIGHGIAGYLNDFIAIRIIKRNQGVFEAESRLWMCYLAVLAYVAGLMLHGAAFQFKLSVTAVIFGWALRQIAVALNTVAVYAYANDCFPKYNGEVSGLMSLFRTLAAFAMSYIQIGWVKKKGALQAFGCEASIVAGLFILVVPLIQIYGKRLRARFSV
ncbi:hypothetical protein M422DRAFT_274492 [Sphaerobolus stellatus SS14]|uniref:Major facilitator superfamily (MFS) profile domain-containing protein n=1 Tax=Sphaerobolus stellatus (strain SS14) TaxID=990650 RepID=A0A0C9UGX3_SPHS4|nr:hypothetical protein M422DRAFT_274492 [Sphaerobolus stellatus SS14]